MMDSKLVSLLLILLQLANAFSPLSVSSPFGCERSSSMSHPHIRYASLRLFAQEENGAEDQEEPVAEAANESPQEVQDKQEEEEVEKDADEKEEETPAEDPEVAELKQQIADLESELKSKRREVSRALEKADKYTKAGYARRVAEMQNMRLTRRSLESLNKYSAQAQVVSNFLPVLDELRRLKEVYAEDEFAQQYGGLLGAFTTLLKKELQVEEYEAGNIGDAFDESRAVAIEEEFSDEFDMGVIIRPTKMGMELQGNIMRMAECVVSLGSVENAQKVVDNAKKAAEEAAAAAAEAQAVAEDKPESEEEPQGE